MSENRAHVPVLFGPVLEYLRPYSNGKYIDGTVGLGGHTAGIAEACAPGGRVLGLDADPLALEYAAENLKRFGDRILLRHSNFLHLRQVAEENEFLPADGVLLDLGLSSLQLADPQRGFSFQSEGHLDMRFDPTQGENAADLINTLDESSLADLIFQFGEEHASRRIARAVVAARPITSAAELGRVIERAVGRHGRLHPATRTFQALRIQVNRELAVLQVDPEAGLTRVEANARLKEHGYNEVAETQGHPVRMFLGKFWGLSAWMLELIMVLSAVLRKYSDLAVVGALLVVNAVLSFLQEHRAAGVVETKRRAARNGRDDRDIVAFFKGGLEILQKTNIVAIDIDIDKAAYFPGVIANSLLNTGIMFFQIIDDRLHVAALRVDLIGAVSKFSERGRNTHSNRHKHPP